MSALIIVPASTGKETVLQLHGWLRGRQIAEFEEVCAGIKTPLCIDLEHLLGADPEGLLALRARRAQGAVLTGASPYLEMLLREGGEGEKS